MELERSVRNSALIVLILIGFLVFSLFSAAQVLQPDEPLTTVIIEFKEPPRPSALAVRISGARQQTPAEQAHDLVARLESPVFTSIDQPTAEVVHTFATTRAVAIAVDNDALLKLQNDPSVARIVENMVFRTTLTESVPLIRANYSWRQFVNGTASGVNITGRGESACIIDTGIQNTHAAFTGRIRNQTCFCTVTNLGGGGCCPNTQGTDTSAEDDAASSHGTHIAGTIAGNGGGVVGVAPDAGLVIAKVCNSAGSCTLADLIAGVDWCVTQQATYNISVVSISIGDGVSYASQNDCPSSALDTAINTAYQAGMFVGIATGNDGYTTGISYPACSPNATAVGSSTKADDMSSFTNRGPLLGVLAPGSNIVSSIRGNTTGVLSGTSMATPHAAAAALLLKSNERLRGRTITPAQIKTLLQSTGKRIDSWQRIDVEAALRQLNYNLSTNQTNRSVTVTGIGRVGFASSVDLSGIEDCLNISSGNITIQSAQCPQFNVSARLQFDAVVIPDAVPYHNGARCPASICTGATYNGTSLQFDVTGFSSYTAGNGFQLAVNDTTDVATVFLTGSLRIDANFSNSTGSANTTDGACSVAVNLSGTYEAARPMIYNATTRRFTTNQTVITAGLGTYNVTCASSGYVLSTIDTFNVTNDTVAPELTVLHPGNNTNATIGVSPGAVWFSVSFADNTTVAYCNLTVNGTVRNGTVPATASGTVNLSVALPNGTYTWSMSCTDGANALTGTIGNLSINVRLMNVPPVFTGAIANQSWTQGTNLTDRFNLSSFISDENNVTVVYGVTSTNNITVSINQSTSSVSFLVPSTFTGTEYVVFNVSDGEYTVQSNNVSLTVTAPDPEPAATPAATTTRGGGGGGGGGGGAGPVLFIKKKNMTSTNSTNSSANSNASLTSITGAAVTCVSQWQCGEWGTCVDGQRLRTCTDTAQCLDGSGMPVVQEACVDTSSSTFAEKQGRSWSRLPTLEFPSGQAIWNTVSDTFISDRNALLVLALIGSMLTSSLLIYLSHRNVPVPVRRSRRNPAKHL